MHPFIKSLEKIKKQKLTLKKIGFSKEELKNIIQKIQIPKQQYELKLAPIDIKDRSYFNKYGNFSNLIFKYYMKELNKKIK